MLFERIKNLFTSQDERNASLRKNILFSAVFKPYRIPRLLEDVGFRVFLHKILLIKKSQP